MRHYIYAGLISLFISSAWAEIPKDMPKRKSGLWELSMKTDAAPPPCTCSNASMRNRMI